MVVLLNIATDDIFQRFDAIKTLALKHMHVDYVEEPFYLVHTAILTRCVNHVNSVSRIIKKHCPG